MIETYIRPYFQQWFVDPIARRLSCYVKPTAVTFAAMLLGGLSGLMILVWPLVAVVLLLLSGYADVLDGSMARLKRQSTSIGCILDILGDRLVESFVILFIFIRQPDFAWLGILMMMAIIFCVSSFLLVGIFSQQSGEKSFYYSPGLMERAESFIFFIIMISWPAYVLWVGLLFTVLVFLTGLIRVKDFAIQIKKNEQGNQNGI